MGKQGDRVHGKASTLDKMHSLYKASGSSIEKERNK